MDSNVKTGISDTLDFFHPLRSPHERRVESLVEVPRGCWWGFTMAPALWPLLWSTGPESQAGGPLRAGCLTFMKEGNWIVSLSRRTQRMRFTFRQECARRDGSQAFSSLGRRKDDHRDFTLGGSLVIDIRGVVLDHPIPESGSFLAFGHSSQGLVFMVHNFQLYLGIC